MKTTKLRLSLTVPALMLATLTACVGPGHGRSGHPAGHANAAGMQGHASSAHMPQGAGAQMPHGDMMAMCAGVRDKMHKAATDQERMAIMRDHMKSMPPDMQKKMHEHMQAHPSTERARMCMH